MFISGSVYMRFQDLLIVKEPVFKSANISSVSFMKRFVCISSVKL